jgi:hypothetical protein
MRTAGRTLLRGSMHTVCKGAEGDYRLHLLGLESGEQERPTGPGRESQGA